MESQPQNPEFGINPENFHPCRICLIGVYMCMCTWLSYSQWADPEDGGGGGGRGSGLPTGNSQVAIDFLRNSGTDP